MSKPPRKHHYTPQVLLGGFTDTGKIDGQLHVIDLVRHKTYESSPHDVGAERDYNLIEIDGVDPLLVESDLLAQKIESPAAAAFGIVRSGRMPDARQRADILAFIAMQALRAPSRREGLNQFSTDVATQILDLLLDDEKLFAAYQERHPETLGKLTSNEVAEMREQIRVSVASDRSFADGGRVASRCHACPATQRAMNGRIRLFEQALTAAHFHNAACASRPASVSRLRASQERVAPRMGSSTSAITLREARPVVAVKFSFACFPQRILPRLTARIAADKSGFLLQTRGVFELLAAVVGALISAFRPRAQLVAENHVVADENNRLPFRLKRPLTMSCVAGRRAKHPHLADRPSTSQDQKYRPRA